MWLYLDIDTINIGESLLRSFKPVAPTIHRLKLQREWSAFYNRAEPPHYWEQNEIEDFNHVEEIYIVCAEGVYAWQDVFEVHEWPCGDDNVFLIDPEDSERIFRGQEGLYEFGEMYDAMLEGDAGNSLTGS